MVARSWMGRRREAPRAGSAAATSPATPAPTTINPICDHGTYRCRGSFAMLALMDRMPDQPNATPRIVPQIAATTAVRAASIITITTSWRRYRPTARSMADSRRRSMMDKAVVLPIPTIAMIMATASREIITNSTVSKILI